jgi:hypothetical protein
MRFLVGLVLVMISSTAFAATSEKFGKGGWIQDFQPEIDRANASGELFRIKGHCQSNCTLFLGLRNVCVERSATCCFIPAMIASAKSMRIPPTGC